MATASNRFFITAIKDGQVASGYLLANMSLQQRWNPTSKEVSPDWSVNGNPDTTNHPVIVAYTRLGGALKAPQDYKWMWNGLEIEFTGNNSKDYTYEKNGQEYPLFIKGTQTVDGVQLPTLTINGNLAGFGSIDQDVIGNVGKIESNGGTLEYSMDILVRISELASTGWQGFIDFDGTGVITSSIASEPGGKVILLPSLYAATAQQSTGSYQVKWYLEGVSDYAGDTRFNTFKTGTQQQMKLELTEADITDNATIRCDFYSTDTQPKLLCSAYQEVDDQVDDDFMYITHPKGSSNANLREDENVVFTVWMASKNDQANVKAAYKTYKLKLLASDSTTCTADLSEIAGNTGAVTDGYMNISKKVTVPGLTEQVDGGQVTVSYAIVDRNGGSVSGIIIASTES